MGTNSSKSIIYAKYENKDGNPSGPLINTEVDDFNKVIEYYKDKSWIEEFLKVQDKYSNLDCLGFRKHLSREVKEKAVINKFAENYSWFTYSQVLQMSRNLAQAIEEHGLCVYQNIPDEGEFNFLGFFSRNMVEYIITDLACMLNSVTSVTLYATLGEEAFEYINEQTELTTMCISPDENIDILIKYKDMYEFPALKNVILFDLTLLVPENAEKKLQNAGFNVYFFSELIKDRDSNVELKISKSDTVYVVCYTSGTTGLPKGAKILQRGIIAQMRYEDVTGMGWKDETLLCYLPLAHIMERINCLQGLMNGCRVGCISGDVRSSLMGDIGILQPTCLIAVPRVLNLMRMVILKKIEEAPEGWKKSIALKALSVKRDNFYNQQKLTHSWYDLLVFKKVRDTFGGKLKGILVGSAPLSKDSSCDLKILFSIPMVEAYGMTENTGALTVTHVNDVQNNSAGGCLYAGRYKLEDVPELNYDSKTELDGKPSPTGEICIYGPMVFAGYLKNPEMTAETIDKDGWLHTGDIGRIMPDNLGLRIIDRKKEIFKLSQGEYIAPTKLEAVYSKSQFIAQICIHGDPLCDQLIAIIVPNRESVLNWLKTSGRVEAGAILTPQEIDEFIDDEQFKDVLKEDLDELAKQNNLNHLEKVNSMVIANFDFTIDNGCLTPTLKVVRRKVVEVVKSRMRKSITRLKNTITRMRSSIARLRKSSFKSNKS
jgi:long-chain acyl-CoA synthetase